MTDKNVKDKAERKPYIKPIITKFSSKALNLPAAPIGRVKPDSEIEGLDIGKLLETYGTPLVIVKEERLRDNFRRMRKAFLDQYDKTIVSWSFKTNYMSAICAILRDEGAWGEVVSGFEYEIARDIGIPGKEIIFNGPHKTVPELERAMNEGAILNADSFDELRLMEEVAKRLGKVQPIGIRVNMNLNYPPWDKFGFNYESGQALEACKMAHKRGHLKVRGFHMHNGTFIIDLSIYTRGITNLLNFSAQVEGECDTEIEYLDIGGGYCSGNTLHSQLLRATATSPTYEQYAEAVGKPLKTGVDRLKRRPILFIEPGRSIVDDTVDTICTVVSSKQFSNGKKGVILDAGVNVLPTCYWYKHEMVAVKEGDYPLEETNVLGGLCMNIDVLRMNTPLPPLKKGDVVIVKSTGAYNFTQSMQFIYPRPAYLLVHEGKVDVVREAETNHYIREKERLPKHLINKETKGSFLLKKEESDG